MDVAVDVQTAMDGLCMRLGWCRGYTAMGVLAGMIPKIAETLVHSAEAPSGRLSWCAGLEATITRAKLSMSRCFRSGDRGA